MPVSGAEVVAKNVFAFKQGFIKTVNTTMEKVKVMLDEKITENITLTDHSLAELAAMGHPYAKRYGDFGMGIHTPYYQVHSQSGQLLSSKRSGTVPASVEHGKLSAIAYVGLDEMMAPHALRVIYGTSKMIPRPVLEGSKDEVVDEAYDLIKSTLKNLKFNFEGKT